MKDIIYNSRDLQPEKELDNLEKMYEEVVSGIGKVEVEEDTFYVNRRFMKGYEVEIASYHILQNLDLNVTENYYLPEENICFTRKVKGTDDYHQSSYQSLFEQNYDAKSLEDSLSAKVLLGDFDITLRNFLVDIEDKIVPIDFEYAGGLGAEKRIELKTKNLIKNIGAETTYEEVLKRSSELYRNLEVEGIISDLKKSDVYTKNVEEIFEYMEKMFK